MTAAAGSASPIAYVTLTCPRNTTAANATVIAGYSDVTTVTIASNPV